MARRLRVVTGNKTEYYLGIGEIDKAPEVLAIVYFDGEPELWALDWVVDKEGSIQPSPEAVRELRRYYHEQFAREVEIWTWRGNKRW